jgi:hypothetical protein
MNSQNCMPLGGLPWPTQSMQSQLPGYPLHGEHAPEAGHTCCAGLTTTSAALKAGIVTSKQMLEPCPCLDTSGVATRLPIHSPSSDPVSVRPASVSMPFVAEVSSPSLPRSLVTSPVAPAGHTAPNTAGSPQTSTGTGVPPVLRTSSTFVMPFDTVAWLTIGDVAADASMIQGAAWSEQERFALAMVPLQQPSAPPIQNDER